MPGVESTWDYKDKHVSVNDVDVNDFVTASRVLIYSAVPTAADKTKYTTFRRIGLIQGMSHGEQRQLDEIFELGSDLSYLIPGRVTGNLSISRVLLNGRDLANVLYRGDDTEEQPVFKSLKEIVVPMRLLFAAYGHASVDGNANLMYAKQFNDCWITSRSEQLAAGQTVILENVSVKYAYISDYQVGNG